MAEATADLARKLGLGHHSRPVEQKIVVVEHVLRLLGLHVPEEKALQVLFPLGTPRVVGLQHVGERGAGIHDGRINRQARSLQRKALVLGRKAELVPHEVHQIGGIFPVVNREGRLEPDPHGVFVQKARTDAVKRTRPRN